LKIKLSIIAGEVAVDLTNNYLYVEGGIFPPFSPGSTWLVGIKNADSNPEIFAEGKRPTSFNNNGIPGGIAVDSKGRIFLGANEDGEEFWVYMYVYTGGTELKRYPFCRVDPGWGVKYGFFFGVGIMPDDSLLINVDSLSIEGVFKLKDLNSDHDAEDPDEVIRVCGFVDIVERTPFESFP
jgi:hypothetical protein